MRGSIPAATIARLPLYLRGLAELEPGQPTCSSDQLASSAGVNSAQVRKDLSYLDPPGVRGVGYNAAALRDLLRRELGLTRRYCVVIAGAGNLGRALTVYPGFEESGFDVVALVDSDQGKAGTTINSVVVKAIDELESIVAKESVDIGVIATPAGAAQEVADRFVGAGVRSILNFAPAVLKRPEGVEVRRVDLAGELQILAYHLSQAR
ncbi:MAG: redox-sensing transcriptional repressor Rex [bacterium]|nr:redox-sensing transcriptional repressor Rex [bacterium]